jgi:hypothetical protein
LVVVVVVLEVDEPVPGAGAVVVVLELELLGEVELGALMLPEEVDGLVLEDELLLGVGLVVVSVVVVDDGGSGGVVVVVELVVELGVEDEAGGVTTVVRSSLRSQAARPVDNAMASALVTRIFDCMGTPFVFMAGNENRRLAPCLPAYLSQVRCHTPPRRRPLRHRHGTGVCVRFATIRRPGGGLLRGKYFRSLVMLAPRAARRWCGKS